MRVFIAIIIAIISCINYGATQHFILQIVLAILAVGNLVAYQGKKTRRSYDGSGVLIATLPYAIILVATLAAVAILVVLGLYHFGIIKTL